MSKKPKNAFQRIAEAWIDPAFELPEEPVRQKPIRKKREAAPKSMLELAQTEPERMVGMQHLQPWYRGIIRGDTRLE